MFHVLIVNQVGTPILEQELSSIDIPDQSGSTSISVIGKLDYDLTRYHRLSMTV